jgi:uncharacterized protein YuzE
MGNGSSMKVTHSVQTDQAYIALKEIADGEAAFQHLVTDERLAVTLVLDISAEGRLIGIDVMGATHGLPPEVLAAAEKIDAAI